MSAADVIDLVSWLVAIAVGAALWVRVVEPYLDGRCWKCSRLPNECLCGPLSARRLFNHQRRNP